MLDTGLYHSIIFSAAESIANQTVFSCESLNGFKFQIITLYCRSLLVYKSPRIDGISFFLYKIFLTFAYQSFSYKWKICRQKKSPIQLDICFMDYLQIIE